MVVDEPFGAVDPIVRDELQQELLRLQRDIGKTIVFVTHDIDEAFLLGDQVVILEKGAKIAQVGTPSEISRNPASDFVASLHTARSRVRLRAAPEADADRQRSWSKPRGVPQGAIVEDAHPWNWVG